MRITFLGTGTSHGVPMLDCMITDYASCPHDVCRKAKTDRRHRRTRASLLVETDQVSVLIDTSQDFRQQMLDNKVKRIDAVLYTHAHADHVYGLPDIRSYSSRQHKPIDVYASDETLLFLKLAFDYVFNPPEYVGGGIPSLAAHRMDDGCSIGDLCIQSLPVEHGPLNGCQGYRIGDVAYISDVKRIPDSTLTRLRDLDLLVLNCLRYRTHSGHLTLEESLAYVREIAPERCLLTHMAHDIDYEAVSETLPEGVSLAYDGLRIVA